jgi:hypothetical protein
MFCSHSAGLGTGRDETRERRSIATKLQLCSSARRLAKVSPVSSEERILETPGEYFGVPGGEILHCALVQINQPNRPHQIPIHSIYVLPPTPAERWSQTVGGRPRQPYRPQPRQRPVSAIVADGHHVGRYLRVEGHHATSLFAGRIDKKKRPKVAAQH